MIDPILSDWFFNYPHPNYENLYSKEMDEGDYDSDEDEPDDDWFESNVVVEAITKDAIQFMKDNSIIIETHYPQFVGAAEKLADDFMRRL